MSYTYNPFTDELDYYEPGAAIGSPISGGTANEVLYIDSSGNLAQSSNLYFDGGTLFLGGALQIGNSGSLEIGTTGTFGPSSNANTYLDDNGNIQMTGEISSPNNTFYINFDSSTETIIGNPLNNPGINLNGNTVVSPGQTFQVGGWTFDGYDDLNDPAGTMESGYFATSGFNADNFGNVTGIAFKVTGGTSSQFLKADGSVDSSTYLPYTNKGTATLVLGTKSITISGLTTSNMAFVTLTTSGGTLGNGYKAVCTTNTLTITSETAAGATQTLDTSTINYLVI